MSYGVSSVTESDIDKEIVNDSIEASSASNVKKLTTKRSFITLFVLYRDIGIRNEERNHVPGTEKCAAFRKVLEESKKAK